MSEVAETKFTQEEVDAFRSILTERDDVTARIQTLEDKGDSTVLEQEQLDKVIKDAVALVDPDSIKKRLDGIETILTRPDASEETRKNITGEFLRARGLISLRAKNGMTIPDDLRKMAAMGSNVPDEEKALLVSDDISAGFLVPEDWRQELIEVVMVEMDAMRQHANVVTTSRNSIQFPTKTVHAAGSWTAEAGTITPDTTLEFGQDEIPTHKQTLMYDVSNEMLEDSAFDINAILRDEYAQEFASDEGAAFTTGNGIGKPSGIMVNAHILASHYTPTGTDSSITDDWDWVPALLTAPKEQYWNNGRLLMSRTTYGVLLKSADGESRPYMTPNTERALPLSLYGFPISLSTSMPAIGSNTFPILFGDLRRAYWIVDRIGMAIQVDPYTQNVTDKTRFVARKRVGGQVVVHEAVQVLKCSAS